MNAWLIIALSLCIVCGVGLALIARRKVKKSVHFLLETKVIYSKGKPCAIYSFEKGATDKKGHVWKVDENGSHLSKTGFDGPYMDMMEAPYENQ